ncbi:MAG: hypothetical protein HOA02_11800 [Planctomycetes bacterium]|nr:hypothetical protein [Planctomycetota bacterium]
MNLRGLLLLSARLRSATTPLFMAPMFVALLTLALFPDSALGQGPCPATSGTTLSPVPLNQPFGAAVSCNTGGAHADTSYYRAFDLCGDYAITDSIELRCITSAFTSVAGGGGTQPVRVRLSIDLDGAAVGPLANLILFYEEEFEVPYNANQLFNFELGTGIVDPDGILGGTASTLVGCLPSDQTLVVEIFTPDGSATGDGFFMAIPDPAQTDPTTDQIGDSFFAADQCGLFEPIDTASLGLPSNMWMMDIAWDDVGDCVCPPRISDLVCQQSAGTTRWDLTWQSMPPVGSFQVEIDGTIEAVLDGTALSYQTDPLSAYQLQQIIVTAFENAGATGNIINAVESSVETAPAHSWFEAAEPITAGDTNFSITSAVTTTGPALDPAVCAMNVSNDQIHHDLYYCFTVATSGDVLVSTCGGPTINTRLAVYGDCARDDPSAVIMCNDEAATGSTAGGTTAAGSNNPACTNFAAELIFEATQGESYLIRLGTFNSNELGDGTVTLIDCLAAPNPAGGTDCNANGILDSCDIAAGATDDNGNGILDQCETTPFVRGDADADGAINLVDAIAILIHLFSGGTIPCNDAADIDDDGALSLPDPIGLLDYMFSNGPAPPPPFPACGIDLTVDALECDSFEACP